MTATSCIWCHAAPRRAHRLTCAGQACRDAQDEHSRPAYDCREYARCDECGADAGAPCADEDDAWTRSPCRGRALLVPEATRCPCGRPARDGETCGRRICRPEQRCAGCGVYLPVSKGRRASAANPCCGAAECVRSIKRTREIKAQRCFGCGVVMISALRSPSSEMPCCGAPECARTRQRAYNARRPRTRKGRIRSSAQIRSDPASQSPEK